MTLLRHLALLVLCCCAATLAACAPGLNANRDTIAERCPASFGGPLLVFELFLGRSMPPFGEVTTSDWAEFVNQVVTPALPNGFTVYDAMGAWMSPVGGKTLYERTKVLMTALPDVPGSITTVRRIGNNYRLTFHQKAVGMTITRACGSF
jgi:Protein of unknown function (DUF3574)